MCMLIGPPKGTKGGLFYNPKEKEVVSTHITYFEECYIEQT